MSSRRARPSATGGTNPLKYWKVSHTPVANPSCEAPLSLILPPVSGRVEIAQRWKTGSMETESETESDFAKTVGRASELPAAPAWGGVNHLALVTPDMDATVRFYVGVLGMALVATTMAGPMRHYFFSIGNGNTVAFFEVPGAETFSKAAGSPTDRAIQLDHISFDVPDEAALETLRVRIAAAGSEVTEVVDHQIFRSIYFTDPNGIALEASYWRINIGPDAVAGDPLAFADPNPVPAVAEFLASGIQELVRTRLV